ncbi:MAG: 4a-hydroxytetrahydrobiopterin dehydratase, partial [Chloroflexi bacterium]|nr:4a-hydroxytetrahydrobiopterin dehydratase [Chloroflexota bacterium]
MSTTKLTEQKCVACRADSPRVTDAEMAEYKPQIPDWQIVTREGIPRLERTYTFKNFREALTFTNQIGELAESEGHHPLLTTEWGKVGV